MSAATFVKSGPAPLEAAGLRWLAAGGARVPEILADAPDQLVLRRIETGRLSPVGEEELGRMLATVHLSGAPSFGALPAPGRYFVGRLEVPSPAAPAGTAWADYYREHRLLPVAIPLGLGSLIERVRIDAPVEPPARLHGDLWSGNVLADSTGRPWLIDPAAYGGHREVDLAMLDLFGAVPDRTRAAYQEISPLADGWRDRIGLWQLFPLLVHAALFGGGYLGQAQRLAHQLAD
jgi:fructosamine-3-kinase